MVMHTISNSERDRWAWGRFVAPVTTVLGLPLLLQLCVYLCADPKAPLVPLSLLGCVVLTTLNRDGKSELVSASVAAVNLLTLILMTCGWLFGGGWLTASGAVIGAFFFVRRWRLQTGSQPARDALMLPLLAYVMTLPAVQGLERSLQLAAESAASRLLFGLGVEHYAERGVVYSCDIPGILYGGSRLYPSLSLFVLLAVMLFLIQRRPAGQLFWYVPAAVFAGGVVNFGRMALIAGLRVPRPLGVLSTWTDELYGILGALVGIALLASASGIGRFMTDRVPQALDGSIDDVVWNPLIANWNWFWGTTVRGDLEMMERKGSSCWWKQLRPRKWIPQLSGFAEKWYFSRRLSRLLSALPIGCLLSWWVWSPVLSEADIHGKLVQGLANAEAVADQSRQRLLLQALCAREPGREDRQFQLAVLMVDMGDVERGLEILKRLSPLTQPGYSPARLWLVQQTLTGNPRVALADEDIYRHLSLAEAEDPQGTEAFRLRAVFYEKQNEGTLAEKWLQRVVVEQPEQYLVLARLQQRLRRPVETIHASVMAAIPTLERMLEENTSDANRVLDLADAWVLAGKPEEARRILTQLVEKQDAPRLRQMLTDLDIQECRRLLGVSELYVRAASALLVKALQRTPGDREALTLLLELQESGGTLAANELRETLTFLRSAVDADVSDLTSAWLLGRVLAATGNIEDAIQALQPAAEASLEWQFLLARWKQRAGQTSEANNAFLALAEECRESLEASPEDSARLTVYVESLIQLRRSEEALGDLIRRIQERPDAALAAPDWYATAQSLQASVCLALFDQKVGYSSETEMPGVPAMAGFVLQGIERGQYGWLMELLKTATTSPATRDAAIQRLCGLAMETGPLARRADALLLELRSEGTLAAPVLKIAGMEALLRKQPVRAAGYLQMGQLLSSSKDPVILNNLAMATLQSPDRDVRKALQYSVQALELVPEHPDLLATQAEILLALGRPEDAVSELQRALHQESTRGQFHELIAEAYARLKQEDKAEQHRELAKQQ